MSQQNRGDNTCGHNVIPSQSQNIVGSLRIYTRGLHLFEE